MRHATRKYSLILMGHGTLYDKNFDNNLSKKAANLIFLEVYSNLKSIFFYLSKISHVLDKFRVTDIKKFI